jgi:hypothetical protein
MNFNDQDRLTEEGFEDLLSGLERLAQNLDAQTYTGQAWPVVRPRPARRPTWKIAAALATTAAIVAMVVHFSTMRPRFGPESAGEITVAGASQPSGDQGSEELAIPEIMIVEDADSYSIIDTTSGEPLVSFATRDSYCPVCVVPLLCEQPTEPTQPMAPVKKI